jgi:Stress responsive A/B Barrel Domain
VIRSITLVKLKDGHDPERLNDIITRVRALRVAGIRQMWAGPDEGLRAGTWDYAIVTDLEGRDAYHAYDTDAEHNLLRQELALLAEEFARCQIEV